MIGFLCAYLRYYHPFEFITAYLNNADNEDDIRNGMELATQYGIKIVPPQFGLSIDKYKPNKEIGVIAKGIQSVKYLNPGTALGLYELSQKKTYTRFIDLLCDFITIDIDTRKRDILIKVDYFKQFGNVKELLMIADFFDMFKAGKAKRVKRETADLLPDECKKYLSMHNKNGEVGKQAAIIDIYGLMITYENHVKSLHLHDISYREKANYHQEYLGYVDLSTGKKEDRRKLLILDCFPLIQSNSKEGKPWAYALTTRSIGSGKVSRLTVKSSIFNNKPVCKSDIIYAYDVYKNDKGYWYLIKYDIIENKI